MWTRRLTAVGANLLLGVPGVVPVWLVWSFLTNGPLADAGLASREPTENDGMMLWLVIIVPVVAVFGIIWWLVNEPMGRRAALDPRVYWPAGVLLTLVPTGVLIVNSYV
ncbi:hypothetical protein [Streptomyces sp. NBC_00059]|uniref:hypothetical protein n=1 Tax=Streptomyces sp. NBC_00059 TaxID=2975635 RepID=UPI002257B253|nr:hypothetical protein [Streptomyces sp. NBC_00059]MCX5412056.1 hypothetical protein [Streptomyces sp. NBC_00059]